MKPGIDVEVAKKHPFFKRKWLMTPFDYLKHLIEKGLQENLITKDQVREHLNAFEDMEMPIDAQISALEMIIIAKAAITQNKWYWDGVNEKANKESILDKAIGADAKIGGRIMEAMKTKSDSKIIT